jgi:hypothetical protein
MKLISLKTRYLIATLFVVLMFVLGIYFYLRPKQYVGHYDFNIPGAKVLFLDNGQNAGNEKVYTVKLQKTAVSIDFNNILAFKGQVSLDDMKAEADNYRSMQLKYTVAPSQLTEKTFMPVNIGSTQGFYQLAEIRLRDGRVNELRNLFIVQKGQPYEVHFSFVKSNVAADNKAVVNTWRTVLDQLGIPVSALPT